MSETAPGYCQDCGARVAWGKNECPLCGGPVSAVPNPAGLPVRRDYASPGGPSGLRARRRYAFATIGFLATSGLTTFAWAHWVGEKEHEATFGPDGISFLVNACEIAVEAKLAGLALHSAGVQTTFPSSLSEARPPNMTLRPGEGTADLTGWAHVFVPRSPPVDEKNLFGASVLYDYTCHARVDNLRWLVTQVSVTAR